jgi:hypothetical protein
MGLNILAWDRKINVVGLNLFIIARKSKPPLKGEENEITHCWNSSKIL